MIYLIYGTLHTLIKKEIKSIINENNLSEIDISKYDLNNTTLTEIIDDAYTISLFNDKKIILVDNAYVFSTINSEKQPQPVDLLEEYLSSINPNTIIIFSSNNEKLDERKKIVKLVKKDFKIIECNKISDLRGHLKKQFNDYEIDDNNISFLINRVGENVAVLEKEIEKIKLYKDTDKKILKEDIIALTEKNIDTDIFKLLDNIINKNPNEAIASYREMLKYNEEPIKIIVMLANKIRMMYQALELSKKGYSKKNIDEIIGAHPYAITKALESARSYSSDKLLDYLLKLGDLDYKIKTGQINKEISLELFILEM